MKKIKNISEELARNHSREELVACINIFDSCEVSEIKIEDVREAYKLITEGLIYIFEGIDDIAEYDTGITEGVALYQKIGDTLNEITNNLVDYDSVFEILQNMGITQLYTGIILNQFAGLEAIQVIEVNESNLEEGEKSGEPEIITRSIVSDHIIEYYKRNGIIIDKILLA